MLGAPLPYHQSGCLTMKCPHCGFDSQPNMIFCGMCGSRLTQVCPECGFANPLDYRFCGLCGVQFAAAPAAPRPPVEAAPVKLEGERRPATVVLADISGSTDLLEAIGSEAWVEIMNHVLQILESEVYRFGGEVDQFRGDGLVAFFGARSAHEDDPERAVLAGLAMQQAIEPYAAELAHRQGIDLLLRVGVNTGQVIVASIGDRRRHSEETAMGQAIALAARMETAAEPGTVLVSGNTYRLTESQFEWEPLGEIVVKGMSQPIAVYRPLAHRTDAPSGRPERLGAYGLAVPLIGREEALDNLEGCVQDLRNGQGGIVLVTGDRGVGKSLLISELRQHVARADILLAEAHDGDAPRPIPLTWLSGRCRSYEQSRPYSLWLDLLRGWLGVREDETPAETRDRLQHRAGELWGDRWSEFFPYLAALQSLPLEEEFAERLRHLDAEGLRQQFFLALWSWVKAMARRGPLALAFSDVHWADTTSLDLLRHCLPLCDHQALLFVIVFRPDRVSPVWEFRHRVETEFPHRVTSLTLPPLTKAQSSQMIDHLIGPSVLPAETRDLVLSKAEGNPYYITEFIHSLIDQGVLAQDAQGWRTTRPVASLDLPDSLQSLLLARIDSLSAGERRVLQMAAVVGSVFWFKVLTNLAGDAAVLKKHLTALQRAQLIRERGRTPDLGMEYLFQSTLIRDAAYEALLGTQRVAYHRQTAEQTERLLGPEALTQHAGVLAYHFRNAEEHRKELFYTLQAAEQARGVYANAEAMEHYTRVVELLDEMEAEAIDENRLRAIRTQRFEALNGRRELFFLMGNFEAMLADAQALLPLAQQLGDDPAWRIDALLQQPGVSVWQTREEAAAGAPLAEEALALSRQLGDHSREMRCLGAIARQRYFLNDPNWQESAERALELARQLGDQRSEVSLLIGMGRVYASLRSGSSSEPERSMEYLKAALPICQALDDKMAELELLDLIGIQLESSDDYYRRLTECHQKQLQISREIGHRPAEAQALMMYGQIQGLYLGDYEAGLSLLDDSLRIWEGIPGWLFPLLRVAQIRAVQGRYDEALAALERASRIGEQNIHDLGRAGLRLVSAILYRGLGDEVHLHRALELIGQVRQMVAEHLVPQQYEMVAACESAAAHLGLAERLADETERRAHLRQALESSQAAFDFYQSFGCVQPIECVSEEILYRHSLALAANGREAEAAEFLQRAYDEVKRKHDLIPADTPFRQTFLENIPLHSEICAACTARLESAGQG